MRCDEVHDKICTSIGKPVNEYRGFIKHLLYLLSVIPHLPALDCDRGMRNPEFFVQGSSFRNFIL
jgi:hypothetical protein